MELLAFAQRVFEGPLQRMYADDMLNSNGPDHARIRRIAAHALTPRKVAGYSADVRSVVDGLVGAIPADTEVDAMTALADELPVSTICQLLGLPRSDVERVHDLLRILPYMLSLDATDHEAELLHAWEQLGVLAAGPNWRLVVGSRATISPPQRSPWSAAGGVRSSTYSVKRGRAAK